MFSALRADVCRRAGPVVTTTLSNMTAKKKLGPSAEEVAARELVRLAKEQGLSLAGPDGLLKQFTRSVLETALDEEMTENLGHEKSRVPAGRESATSATARHRDHPHHAKCRRPGDGGDQFGCSTSPHRTGNRCRTCFDCANS